MKRKLPAPPPKVPPGVKLIGIRVGDNDFHRTFIPFVRLLLDSPLMDDKPSPDLKETVAQLFNDAVLTFYRICQDNGRCSEIKAINRYGFLREYLALSPTQVLLDEEVTDYLENQTGHHNGDFYYADIARGEVVTV